MSTIVPETFADESTVGIEQVTEEELEAVSLSSTKASSEGRDADPTSGTSPSQESKKKVPPKPPKRVSGQSKDNKVFPVTPPIGHDVGETSSETD